ncbi:MAG: O-antigen ligase family protein [Anaerolineae bacterium]|nr:O-antigen ligase family protein [Anaerolineae bacterium]
MTAGARPLAQANNRAGLIALCVAVGVAVGAAGAFVNPLLLLGAVAGLGAALWAVRRVEHALLALVIVIGLMPRFALPLRLGFTPTFLDLALLGLILAWAFQQLKPQPLFPIPRISIALPILLLVAGAVITFILGLPNGALTPMVLRRFAELVLSLLSVLVLAATLQTLNAQRQLVQWLMLAGAGSALIGIVLYLLPDDLAIRALSALRPFGYPSGPGVLRFIRDDPALMQRATGLWIDPNAFGGFLLVAGALGVPHLFAQKPVLARGWVLLSLLAIVVALVLTVSRGAMLSFVVAALAIGVLRYRRLLFVLALALVFVLLLPHTRDLVTHFVEGFQGRDLATQMRFGEYKDALRLIERYPLFGVGFISTPDVDLYIGVSSMYLLIAQQMGLVGLALFAAVMLVLFAGFARAWWRARHDEAHAPILLGAHGAVLGILVSGVFDHYFFNIDFHNAVMLFCLVLALAAASQRLAQPTLSAQ